MTAALEARKQTEHDDRVEVIARDVQACRAHELPDDLANAIENARMNPCFDHLNALTAETLMFLLAPPASGGILES